MKRLARTTAQAAPRSPVRPTTTFPGPRVARPLHVGTFAYRLVALNEYLLFRHEALVVHAGRPFGCGVTLPGPALTAPSTHRLTAQPQA